MPLISKDTKGVFVISATPFDEVGNLDIDSFLNFCVQPLKDNPMDMLLELRKGLLRQK